jgi:tRNA U34 5-carboxymethylaminomethyl modifying GTPase MnmE/TrmE
MGANGLELFQWAAAGNRLLQRSKELLAKAHDETVRELAARIPAAALGGERPVRIVFAGQYSAGKSSIIRALTGRDDIETGAGITTQEARTFEWEGVALTDTPGVHTEIRPDHDEISYRAIAEADLLVFAVTNELFDSHLAEHFRQLAVERDKAHEMMLVVNKMQRCAKGNSPEMHAVIREDLANVLVPFSPEDLRICFVDAESALESRKEADPFFAGKLWRRSGFGHFIDQLNRFVREKGIAGRCTSALYSLEQTLQEALAAASTSDPDSETVENLLLQRRRALLEAKARIPLAVAGAAQRKAAEIREEGRRVAAMINESADPQEVNAELQSAQGRVELLADELQAELNEIMINKMQELGKQIDAITDSEPARRLSERLASRLTEGGDSGSGIQVIANASGISSDVGKFLSEKAVLKPTGSFSGLFKLGEYSGSTAHKAIKTVGGFFGKKFRPWEAVKWTRIVAIVGKALQVFGVILQIVLQYKQEADAEKRERELKDSRAAVQRGFNDAAQEIVAHYNAAATEFIESEIVPEIEKNDRLLEDLRNMRAHRNSLDEALDGLLQETREMIRALHADTLFEKDAAAPVPAPPAAAKAPARPIPAGRSLPPDALGTVG